MTRLANKCSIWAFLCVLPFMGVEAGEHKLYEMPRTEVVPIQDTQADRRYELYIKLPAGYADNKEAKYPVIYFTDAVWHIDILSAATEYLMEDVILVGISWQKDIKESLLKEKGEHVSRFRDYSLRPSSNPEVQAKYQLGQAGHHLAFIRNDVIPHVEKHYRTAPGNRTYFGYSAGGEFGAYALLTQPDTFKNYILGSPSINGEIPHLSKLGPNAASKRKDLNTNVFVSYGAQEKELGTHIDQLVALLKDKKDASLSLTHVVVEGDHQRAFPMTGIRSVNWLSNLQNKKDKG